MRFCWGMEEVVGDSVCLLFFEREKIDEIERLDLDGEVLQLSNDPCPGPGEGVLNSRVFVLAE